MLISGGQFLSDFFDILTVIFILATIYPYKFSKHYDTLIQSYALLEIHGDAAKSRSQVSSFYPISLIF
jgi:hypothetical protein